MKTSPEQVNQTIYQSWCDILGQVSCDHDADFFDLGGTSLQAVDLFSQLEKEFEINLPTTILLEHPTVEQLSTEIYKRLTAKLPKDDCLSLLQRNPGDKNLFLFHPIGGLSAVYVKLARSLKFDGSIYGISAPKMDAQECRQLSVEKLARRYSNAIEKIQPNGDFLLAGYSAGGIFAFATACELQSKDQKITYLGLIETLFTIRHYPQQVALPRRLLAYGHYLWRRGLADGLKDIVTNNRLQEKRQALHNSRLKTASLDQQREQLLRNVIESQDFTQWYTSIQAILQVLIKYYEPPIFYSEKNKTVLYQTATYLTDMRGDIGWARLVAGEITNRFIDGDHLTVLKAPNHEKLAEIMSSDLKTAPNA